MAEGNDLVVLGSGAGGKLLSWTLAAGKQRVAVVERKYVGGSCPNIACLPPRRSGKGGWIRRQLVDVMFDETHSRDCRHSRPLHPIGSATSAVRMGR
jgi:hypothetical protein